MRMNLGVLPTRGLPNFLHRFAVPAICDVLIVFLAYAVAYLVRGTSPADLGVGLEDIVFIVGVVACFMVVLLWGFGVYQRTWSRANGNGSTLIVSAVAAATALILIFLALRAPRGLPVSVVLLGNLLSLGGFVASRYRTRLMSVRTGLSDVVLRDVGPDDLLGRKAITRHKAVDLTPIMHKSVLVTGAAGSIGAELSRQLCDYEPRQLILLDVNESGLHDLTVELQARYPDLNVLPVLADITLGESLKSVFEAHQPHIVFHGAAYKHVSMLERYPEQAVRVNIGGTLNLARLACDYGVERFVLISTNNAANPTSVMGASKQVGEQIVHAIARSCARRTLFTSVRFGDVLSSRGGLVSTLMNQIKTGGPVTIIDPETRRNFMSTAEAVNLIIHAACLTKGDDVFALKPGEAIKMGDLARRMIELFGKQPEVDIPIRYTGVRPGEMLYDEQLAGRNESAKATPHPDIIELSKTADLISPEETLAWVEGLLTRQINKENALGELLRGAVSGENGAAHPMSYSPPAGMATGEVLDRETAEPLSRTTAGNSYPTPPSLNKVELFGMWVRVASLAMGNTLLDYYHKTYSERELRSQPVMPTAQPAKRPAHTLYRAYGKRALDIVGSLAGLLMLSPVLALVALLVRIKLGSPVLFKQVRPGLNGRPFTIYKFRTMTDARDEKGQLLPDDKRLTRFGQFLRSTSLDELPELINVLKGDMSLVGPRPLIMRYLPRYTPEQARRNEVKPGITGWAQINGRNALSWEERFKQDVWYVDNYSLWLDLKILFMTIRKVLKREGISEAGHVTMSEFMGTPQPSQQAQLVGERPNPTVITQDAIKQDYVVEARS